MLSCEYCGILTNTYFGKHLRTAASTYSHLFAGKQPCTTLPWSAWTKIAQETYLSNAGPQYSNNFSQKNNLQFCVEFIWAEVVAKRCSVKKVFLEISLNSQESTCARVSFLIKLQASGTSGGCFCLGQHCKRKIPVECWPMAKVQFLWGR